jgi:hypothetical protein
MIKFLIRKIQHNSYYYFIAKLIALITIIFILDFFIGNILHYFYFRQESGLQYRTTYSIEKTNADLLIFGSSRANHHYEPNIFESNLNLTYYNVGRDGNFIFYHYAVLKGALKRYKPKVIILDIIRREFQKDQDSYDRLSILLPYYQTHSEIQPIIELKSNFEKFKLISNIYPFNSSLFTILTGNLEFNKKRKSDIKGYVPLSKTLDRPIQIDNSPTKYMIDSLKVKFFESFIKDCIQSNVKLYIVCSPYYIKFSHSDYTINQAKEIAKNNNIPFFDYSNDSVFINNPQLFTDFEHLNDNGAKIFSKMLIDKIHKN